MTPPLAAIHLDIHGVAVTVESNDPALVVGIHWDFDHFAQASPPAGPRSLILARSGAPPWEEAPAIPCSQVYSNCCVFDDGEVRWVDYHGRALARWDYASESGTLWSPDPELLHELTYLLVQSRSGRRLDERGVHRIHALGLARDDAAVLVLFPSGGGKTTIGFHMLRRTRIGFLSDDSPCVTRAGEILNYPIRMGLLDEPDAAELGEEPRLFRRRHHGAKWLIRPAALGNPIPRSARPGLILVGRRQLNGPPRISRISRIAAAKEVFESLVVGLGLAQVIEFFLRFTVREVLSSGWIVASRTVAFFNLMRRSECHEFLMARDLEANGQALIEFLGVERK